MRVKSIRRTAFLFTVCVLIAQLTVFAYAKASDYIVAYAASTTANTSNRITVSFNVTANGPMDKIGATTIYLYEKNGNTTTLVATFTEKTNTSMTSTNKTNYGSSVTYQGQAGRIYHAVVHVYAGKDGKGDTRTKTTGSVAT